MDILLQTLETLLIYLISLLCLAASIFFPLHVRHDLRIRFSTRKLVNLLVGLAFLLIWAVFIIFIPVSHSVKSEVARIFVGALIFRALRVTLARSVSHCTIALLFLTDIILFALIGHGSDILPLGGVYATIRIFLRLPLIILILLFYVTANIWLLAKARLKLAAWRLLAYSLKEAQLHNRAITHPEQPAVSVRSVTIAAIDSFWIVLVIVGSYLFAQPVAVAIVAGCCTIGSAILWPLARRDGYRGFWNSLAQIAVTGSIVAILLVLISLRSGLGLWSSDSSKARFLRSFELFTPTIVTYILVRQKIKDALISKLSQSRREGLVLLITRIIKGVHSCVYSNATSVLIQSYVLAAVFLLYLLFPLSAPIFSFMGVKQLAGRPVVDLIAYFDQLRFSGLRQVIEQNEFSIGAIFAEQGLVLVILVWSLTVFMIGGTTPIERLAKMPQRRENRIGSFGLLLLYIPAWIAFFVYYFLIALALPYFGVVLLGPSITLVVGVFAFGSLFPRLNSFVSGLIMLLIASIVTDPDYDSVDVNSASMEELMRLPGIGEKTARKIIAHRPYCCWEDLSMSVQSSLREQLGSLVCFGAGTSAMQDVKE